MYCISKGEVEVIQDEDSPPVAVLKEGDLFGEVNSIVPTHDRVCIVRWFVVFQINLVYGVPSGGIVRAKTHCDILLLSKTDVQHILQHFPEGEQQFETIQDKKLAHFSITKILPF